MTDTRDHPPEIADSERPAARPLRGEGMRAMQGYAPEKVEPTDSRIRDVPMSAIDTSNLNVYGPEDPRGDSYAQIADGVHKLENTVRPGVAAGKGPNGEKWSGAGKTPNWLQALADAGHDIEQFRT